MTFNHETKYYNTQKKIKLQLLFDKDYPYNPPKVKFITKMFHPNIEENGMLASKALFEKWDFINDLIMLFSGIKHILKNPNLQEGLIANQLAFEIYLENKN